MCQAMSVEQQYAHLPAALLGSLKRDKKPFTYTPGGVDLSQVLEARLKRRLERKHRRELMEPAAPKQVVVAPTYNTPLNMYSQENALEALELQMGLRSNCNLAEETGASSRSVAQSRAFKVLQIITDTEETEQPPPPPAEIRRAPPAFRSAVPAPAVRTDGDVRPHSFPVARAAPLRTTQADAPPAISTTLKRPAAFLPKRDTPPALQTPLWNARHLIAGTDF